MLERKCYIGHILQFSITVYFIVLYDKYRLAIKYDMIWTLLWLTVLCCESSVYEFDFLTINSPHIPQLGANAIVGLDMYKKFLGELRF